MNYKLLILFLSLFVVGCRDLSVESEELPDVYSLTPSTITTPLPVINIDADPIQIEKLLTQYYNKVYVKGHLSVFNTSSSFTMQQVPMEMEVRGRTSVGASFPLKSLGVKFEHPLQPNALTGFTTQQVLPGHSLDWISTLRLRSSGNDFGLTMIKDLAYSRFAVQNQLNIELMYGIPVQVFLNKEYYGLVNARSESDVLGMANLLQIDTALITMIKVKNDDENLKYDGGNRAGCEVLFKAIKQDDSPSIREQIDIDNFIDYIIYQDYIGNADWGNNIKAYNSGNGKFRFILFDVDLAGNASTVPLIPKLEFLSADIAKIYRALQEDNGFDERLENRKKILYQRFSVNHFNQIVDDMASEIANDIPFLIARYGRPESMLHWRLEIEKLKLDFEGRDHAIRKKYDLN